MARGKPSVLLLTGGDYHNFECGAALIQQVLATRFSVTHTTKVSDLSKIGSGKFRAVVVYTQGGTMSDAQAKALEKFVSGGGGLVGIHCAADSFTKNSRYMKLIGSQFASHGPVADFEVTVTDPQHPVVTRTENFLITDELYVLKDHADYDVFATAHWQGLDRPMGYERRVGEGRVIYLANGHDPAALSNRYFQRLIERATRVACGERFETEVRAGMLGYGGAFNMGLHHAQLIDGTPGMSATAVCDVDPARTDQARVELGDGIATFNDMNRFLRDGDFDMVISILPHHLHAKAAVAASKAGKHLITEKPFCITLKEADQMIAAADEAGKMLSVFHNRRWDADFHLMLKLVRDGQIGDLYRIDASSAGYGRPGTWWRSDKAISGGAMYDWGAHYMDWTLNFMNKRIESVTGDFQKRKWHHVTNEDYTYALMRFEDGSTATLEQGAMAAVARPPWRILGTEGALERDANDVVIHRFDGKRMDVGRMPIDPGPGNNFYANIGNHLIMDEALIVTPQQARRAIGVIYLAEQSAKRGGKPLPLPGEDAWTPDYAMPW